LNLTSTLSGTFRGILPVTAANATNPLPTGNVC